MFTNLSLECLVLLYSHCVCADCHLQHFPVETSDLAGICWSPDGRVLCVWDSLLNVRFFCVFIFNKNSAYNTSPCKGRIVNVTHTF